MFWWQSRCDLFVTGRGLQLGGQQEPAWVWRSTYQPPPSGAGQQHQHEIANHYRDYRLKPSMEQLRRRQRRRRRMQLYPLQARQGSGGERRQVALSVQKFPSFAAVYRPPRGRQTLCERQPPDRTYNETVRRIQSATQLGEFRQLVQQQLGHWQRHQKRHQQTATSRNLKKPQPHSSDSRCPSSRAQFDFVQAACALHEASCISSINYLQRVGERNVAVASKRAEQQANERTPIENVLKDSKDTSPPLPLPRSGESPTEQCSPCRESAESPSPRTESSATAEAGPAEPQDNRTTHTRALLKSIGAERSFCIGRQQQQPTINWSIKVNITRVQQQQPSRNVQHVGEPAGDLPQAAPCLLPGGRKLAFATAVRGIACKQSLHQHHQHHQQHHQQQQQQHTHSHPQQIKGILKAPPAYRCPLTSMSGPLCIQAINLENPYRPSAKGHQQQGEQQQQQGQHRELALQQEQQEQQHLIENLQQLQICGDDDNNLPRITVNDYSSRHDSKL